MRKSKLSMAVCLCTAAALIFVSCAKSPSSSSVNGTLTNSVSEQISDSGQTSASEQISSPEQSSSSGQTTPEQSEEQTSSSELSSIEQTTAEQSSSPEQNPTEKSTTENPKPTQQQTTVSGPKPSEPQQTTPAAEKPSANKLSNPNADAVTAKVYNYVCETFGKQIMTCQQESTWMGSPDYEMDYILETTGKLPAIRGLDYMNNDFKGVNERAISWWKKGGLVSICWHTGVNGSGYQESLNDNPNFDKLLTEGTPEYNAMMKSWDEAATALAELRDAGVPVLWRPFHEFDGKWFWWGKGGSENFIKLWRLMYDKFTNEYGLTNLIWVLGYSGEVRNGWYVGDEYCDIIGSDTYDNSTNAKAWKRLKALNTDKPMAFHECGNVPAVDKFINDGCIWSWFMIWHTDHIKNNNADNLKKVYNDSMVITLDELPDFR